jgi:hypothetical protein
MTASVARAVAGFVPAFALGAGTAVAVLLWLGQTALRLPGTTVPAAYAAAPLAGLAVFQIAFGLIARRWRGLLFWAAALPVKAAVTALALTSALTARVAAPVALAAALSALFLFGLWAAARGAR